MTMSNIKAEFACDAQTLWERITSLKNYRWRSDIQKIEVITPEKEFREYTKNGFPTTFIVTAFEPCKRYAFDMENEKMEGRWTGILTETAKGTEIDFTEVVTAKKLLLKPFVGRYLKKQQARYVADLQKSLEEG